MNDENVKENEQIEIEVELYEYCASTKKRCLNDCIEPWRGTPVLSDVN